MKKIIGYILQAPIILMLILLGISCILNIVSEPSMPIIRTASYVILPCIIAYFIGRYLCKYKEPKPKYMELKPSY